MRPEVHRKTTCVFVQVQQTVLLFETAEKGVSGVRVGKHRRYSLELASDKWFLSDKTCIAIIIISSQITISTSIMYGFFRGFKAL